MSGDADASVADHESDAVAEEQQPASRGEREMATTGPDGEDTDTGPADEATADAVAGDVAVDAVEDRPGSSASELAGATLLVTVPVALLSIPIAGVLAVTNATPAGMGTGPLAILLGTVLGLGGSAALGPVLVRRSLRGIPDAAAIDSVEDRVESAAAARAMDSPEVRFVDADAATIGVVDGLGAPTVLVPSRIGELDADAQAAVVDHALTRIETRNAALSTALLAPALLVEAWTLLGLELARRREEPEEDDRLPQMLGAGDRKEREVPWMVFAAAGVVLLVTVAPVWVVFAVGDRLLVGGGRARVDDVVGRTGAADDAAALAEALTFARDARGDRDWPPTLDRLSLLGMADPVTQRVRGTSRIELRVRLARLRARENRAGSN